MVRIRLTAFVLTLLLLPACFNGVFNGTVINDVSTGTRGPVSLSPTVRGGLFSHTVEPFSINREATEVKKILKEGRGRVNQFQYPVTTALSIRIGKNGLGDVAKEQGIETIYYADIERWSALFGLWSMDIVHIYGR